MKEFQDNLDTYPSGADQKDIRPSSVPSMLVVVERNDPNIHGDLGDGIFVTCFRDLASAIRNLPRIEIVLSPIVSVSFDVAEVAEILFDFGFDGKFRVLTTDASNISVIKDDIHAMFPHLDFGVFVITESGGLDLA